MEQIIDKLYELSLNTPQHFDVFDKETIDKEWRCYDYLYKNLNEKCKKVFIEYLELRSSRNSRELQIAYESGFKTAVQLFTEALKE